MKPAWWLRLEAVALLLAALVFCRQGGRGWGFMAIAALAPDLGVLGYLGGKRAGAWTYNVTHSTVLPLAWALWICAGTSSSPFAAPALWMPALWLAHIGLDRCLGFGLKYPDSFKTTHLQKL